ncbi:neuropeptide Y receptor type 2-like, partial [Physella acuta]|uniref:neuropeptide Y receptor type 2-like n=1 Tax=Physella acuta TaxID=109671 RepID=UPI0027DBD82F
SLHSLTTSTNMADNCSEQTGNASTTPETMLFIVQEFTNQTFWFSPTTVIALVISYCFVIVAGLAGNILVIVVICRKKALRSSRNIYILNLSVCDVIMCSICMPFSLVQLTLKKWTMGSVMCRIVPALATIDVFVSTLTIVVIALDRYMSIVHTSQLTTRHVVSALLVIWILSILLSTPLFSFHKIETQEMYEHRFFQVCIDHWPDDLFREIYTTSVMLIQYLTPASFISCLHARICKFLQYRLEERPGSDTQISERAKDDLKRHRRNMVLLTAMALIFSVTWLPLTLLNITADLDHTVFQEGDYNLMHAVCLLIAMSSSVANPVMYGWFNSNFRKAFCEFLGFLDSFGGKVSCNDKTSKKASNSGNFRSRNLSSSKSYSTNEEKKARPKSRKKSPGRNFRFSFEGVSGSQTDDRCRNDKSLTVFTDSIKHRPKSHSEKRHSACKESDKNGTCSETDALLQNNDTKAYRQGNDTTSFSLCQLKDNIIQQSASNNGHGADDHTHSAPDIMRDTCGAPHTMRVVVEISPLNVLKDTTEQDTTEQDNILNLELNRTSQHIYSTQ